METIEWQLLIVNHASCALAYVLLREGSAIKLHRDLLGLLRDHPAFIYVIPGQDSGRAKEY